MEFRATVTIAEHGHDARNGESFLAGFVLAHPGTGPVVDQNIETGKLSVTFSFDADDLFEAMRVWTTIFVDGANASGLSATALTDFALAADVHIAAVREQESDYVEERSLDPVPA